jgi:hypothetical protein
MLVTPFSVLLLPVPHDFAVNVETLLLFNTTHSPNFAILKLILSLEIHTKPLDHQKLELRGVFSKQVTFKEL